MSDTPHPPLPAEQESSDIDEAVARAPVSAQRERQLQELGLRLPQHWNTTQFTEALQEIRKTQFKPGERTLYNHLVCQELARRGEPPNSANVLKCGAWGSSLHVAVDVRSWYAALASKLASRQPNIPDGARRQANELVEQLWSIAYEKAREPLQLQATALREELAAAQQVLADSEVLIKQLQDAKERDTAQLRAMEGELTGATGALAQLREQSTAQIAELNTSIAARALEHRN